MFRHDPLQLIYHAIELQGANLILNLVVIISAGAFPYIAYLIFIKHFSTYLTIPRQVIALLLLSVSFLAAYAYSPALLDSQELILMKKENAAYGDLFSRVQRKLGSNLGPFYSLKSSLHQVDPIQELEGDLLTKEHVSYPKLISPETWAKEATSDKDNEFSNVILLVIESLRSDVINASLDEKEITPNLNKLVITSAQFSHHFSNSSHSSYADIVPIASQSPARQVGQHVYAKAWDYPRPRIYDLLSSIGYKTAIISSQDERWGGMFNYLDSDKLDDFVHAGNSTDFLHVDDQDTGFSRFAKIHSSGKLDDSDTINLLSSWIKRNVGQPFFVYTNLQNSHFPYRVPENFPSKFTKKINFGDVGFNSMTHEMLPEMKRRYLDSLNYVDFQIGRLIEMLKKQGLLEDTLIIVTGDTGQAFLEHGYSNHSGPMYNEVLKTPLILHLPNKLKEHQGKYSFTTSHSNIAPTILSLLDLPDYSGFQGESIFKEGRFTATQEPIFLAANSPLSHQFGVIVGSYKFLYGPNFGTKELYNIHRDPRETLNLYDASSKTALQIERILKSHLYYQLDYYSTPEKYLNSFPPLIEYPNL